MGLSDLPLKWRERACYCRRRRPCVRPDTTNWLRFVTFRCRPIAHVTRVRVPVQARKRQPPQIGFVSSLFNATPPLLPRRAFATQAPHACGHRDLHNPHFPKHLSADRWYPPIPPNLPHAATNWLRFVTFQYCPAPRVPPSRCLQEASCHRSNSRKVSASQKNFCHNIAYATDQTER